MRKKQKKNVLKKACIHHYMESLCVWSILPFSAVIIFLCHWLKTGKCLLPILLIIPLPTILSLLYTYFQYPLLLAAEDTDMWDRAADTILSTELPTYLDALMFDADYKILDWIYEEDTVVFRTKRGDERTLYVPHLEVYEERILDAHGC